jgi:hypothetical protein
MLNTRSVLYTNAASFVSTRLAICRKLYRRAKTPSPSIALSPYRRAKFPSPSIAASLPGDFSMGRLPVGRLSRHPLSACCLAVRGLHRYLLVGHCLAVLPHCLRKETPRENSVGRMTHAPSNAGLTYMPLLLFSNIRSVAVILLETTGTLESFILFFLSKARYCSGVPSFKLHVLTSTTGLARGYSYCILPGFGASRYTILC